MIWGPFLLALALGLAVSAGLYFAYLWPQVEPDDEAIDAAAAATASTAAPATAKGEEASTETEAEASAAAPSSETSPA